MTQDYTADSIEILSGLQPVQKRPGMYTDTERPNHLGQEVIDNSLDEALAGHADNVDIKYYKDGSLSVRDDGRGIPVDIHPEKGVPAVVVIFTVLHAGGKFSGKNYDFSGGLHGVGISVVNALSKRVEVEIKRDGHVYSLAFEHGVVVEELKVVEKCNKKDTGTFVRFWPDESYFDSPRINTRAMKSLLKAKAILCNGVKISFEDESTEEVIEWQFENGMPQYIKEQTSDLDAIPALTFHGERSSSEDAVAWALSWTPEHSPVVKEAFVNLIPTSQGGTHVSGLRQGLVDAVKEFCDFRNLLPKGVKLTPEDVFSSVNFLLSIKIKDPKFAGQTKEKLSNREAAKLVSDYIKDAFSLYLNEHVDEANLLVEHFIAVASKRLRAAKKVSRKKVTQGPALPGKLTDCTEQDLSRSELFLVEGDSAGGSAKQARDKEFQAIMPLRGKILNTWEVSSDTVLSSAEIHDISVALGIDPASDDLSGLRYGKVCILADADSDGLHIATLLCALFVKHFLPLVKAGHVYVAMPPLYRIDSGKDVYYALDDEEKDSIVAQILAKKSNAKYDVQRFKGLGEMNPGQLRETTMSPNTRRLVQLEITDDQATEEMMNLLLGKKNANDRKTWLQTKGNQAEVA